MSEQPGEREQRLTNERNLYRYSQALARGDIETIATILEIASQNADLERMIYAMHELDQSNTDAFSESQQNHTSKPVAPAQAGNRAPKTTGSQRTSGSPRRLLQTLAALLVVAALITGSVLLFASHRPTGTAGNKTSTPPASTKTVAADGTVILMLENGEILAEHGRTGQRIWSYPTNQQTLTNGLSSFDEMIVQNHVVYVAIKKSIYALNEDNGKLIWHKNFTLPDQQGSISQILVDGDIVYDSMQGDPNSVAYALNASDGAILWQVSSSDDSSPLIAASNGIAYVSIEDANYQTVMQARRGSDGQILWKYNSPGEISFGAVANNVFYVYAFPGAVPPGDGKLNKQLLAFNVSNGNIIWSQNIHYGNYNTDIAYAQGTLIIPNGQQICVHNSSNGHLLWCTPDETTSSNNASLANYLAGPDQLYASYFTSKPIPLSPTEIAEICDKVPQATRQSCVNQANQGVFDHVQYTLQVVALDYQTGHTLWTSQPVPDTASQYPLAFAQLQRGTLLLTNGSSQLIALDASNGHQLWQIAGSANQSAVLEIIATA